MFKPEILEIQTTNNRNGSFYAVKFNDRLAYTTKQLRCEKCDSIKEYLVWEFDTQTLHCTKENCIDKSKGSNKLGIKVFDPV